MSPIKIGRYQIIEEIGRGAMGVVYRALDPNIGREVALKTIHLNRNEPQIAKRFRFEARASGVLSHPNIVTIYDADEDNGVFYIAMELVKGQTLQQIMGGAPMQLNEITAILEQVGAALDYAHSRQVIHRDIKPANVMVENGNAKVMDFGIAKISTMTATATTLALGTPAYMAPEHVRGEQADARSDVFSVGSMLYEMLTGTKPFPGEHLTAIIFMVISGEPSPPSRVDPLVHPGMNYIVRKALAKDPAQRYQTCAELIADLKNYRAFEKRGKEIARRAAATAALAPQAAPETEKTVMLDRSEVPMEPKPPTPPLAVRTPISPKKIAVTLGTLSVLAFAGGVYWHHHGAAAILKTASQPPILSPAPVLAPSPAPERAPPLDASAPPTVAPSPPLSPPNKVTAARKPSKPSAAQVDLKPVAPVPEPAAVAPATPLPAPAAPSPPSQESASLHPAVPGAADQMGRVVVHTEPQGARILIDGKDSRYRSPVNFAVAAGKHQITVERRGLPSQTQEIDVRANENLNVDVDLTPESGKEPPGKRRRFLFH